MYFVGDIGDRFYGMHDTRAMSDGCPWPWVSFFKDHLLGEKSWWVFPHVFVRFQGGASYVLKPKLPLFPYGRGWETQPDSRG